MDTDRDRELVRLALEAAPRSPEPPPGTKLVLMSDELMDALALPRDGYSVTWQWGEPDENGWYTPTFTETASPETPEAGIDVELLAEALVHWDVDDETFRAQPTAGNIEAWRRDAEKIAAIYVRLSEEARETPEGGK